MLVGRREKENAREHTRKKKGQWINLRGIKARGKEVEKKKCFGYHLDSSQHRLGQSAYISLLSAETAATPRSYPSRRQRLSRSRVVTEGRIMTAIQKCLTGLAFRASAKKRRKVKFLLHIHRCVLPLSRTFCFCFYDKGPYSTPCLLGKHDTRFACQT